MTSSEGVTAGTVTIKVIWGGPTVGTLMVEEFVGGIVEGIVDGMVGDVKAGVEDGAGGENEGGLTQPSNTAIRGSARARIREKSFNDFIFYPRYVSTERKRTQFY